MECRLPLSEVDKELDYVCLRWSTTDEETYRAVAEEPLNNRSNLNVGVWVAVEHLRAFVLWWT